MFYSKDLFNLKAFRCNAGRYSFKFDGSNFASGVNFYRIEAGNFVQTKKMVLLK